MFQHMNNYALSVYQTNRIVNNSITNITGHNGYINMVSVLQRGGPEFDPYLGSVIQDTKYWFFI